MAADLARWRKAEALRRAEVAYITDDAQHSAEYWWEQLCREVCPLHEFRANVQHGRWVARREKYRHGVTQAVLRETKRRAVNDLIRELQEIQQIRQNTLELIQPRIINGQKVYRVQPQSYEGLVRAVVMLDQAADAKRQVALQTIEPDLEQEMGRPQTVFSPDEVRSVARMLLESRRAKQQQQVLPALPEHTGEEDDGEGEGEGEV